MAGHAAREQEEAGRPEHGPRARKRSGAAEPGERRGTAGLLRRLQRLTGPGLITGAADDDPAGITTYTQAGAQFGFGLLWTVAFQIPLMSAVQLMCARIGRASGRDLAGVLAKHYPRWILWLAAIILLVSNTVTAAADLDAVAAALSILTGLPTLVFVLPVAAAITALVAFASYERLRSFFKWTTLALFAYLASAILARPDWVHVLRATVVPEVSFSSAYLYMFVAVFGTTISPYLFFWQAAEEMEEEKAAGRRTVSQRRGTSPRVLRMIRADTITGMAVSQLIGYFVIVSTGTVLFTHGQHDVQTAQQAALALHPLGAGVGTILFCVGFIGTGILAIPTLTGGASYVLAALFAWKTGIGEKPRRAPRFYLAMTAATLVAVALDFTGVSPVKLLIGSAVLSGLLAPPLMVIILIVSNNEKIMAGYTNARLTNILGIVATAIMALAAIALLGQLVLGGGQ